MATLTPQIIGDLFLYWKATPNPIPVCVRHKGRDRAVYGLRYEGGALYAYLAGEGEAVVLHPTTQIVPMARVKELADGL